YPMAASMSNSSRSFMFQVSSFKERRPPFVKLKTCNLKLFLCIRQPLELRIEKHQRDEHDDHRAGLDRERRAGPFGDETRLHAAQLAQARGAEAVDAHHAPAIVVRHRELYQRVQQRVENRAERTDDDKRGKRNLETSRGSEDEQRRGRSDEDRDEDAATHLDAAEGRERQRADDRSETGRRGDEAEPRRADVQDLLCEDRQQDDVGAAQNAYERRADQQRENELLVADITQSVEEALRHADSSGRVLRRDVHAKQRPDDREVAHGVDVEAAVDADAVDEQADQARAEEPRTLPGDRVERERVHEVFAADELGNQRLAHRLLEGPRGRSDRAEDENVPRVNHLERHENGQDKGGDERDDLNPHHHESAVPAVCDEPANEEKAKQHRRAQQAEEAEDQRRIGQLVQEPALGDILHPGAD